MRAGSRERERGKCTNFDKESDGQEWYQCEPQFHSVTNDEEGDQDYDREDDGVEGVSKDSTKDESTIRLVMPSIIYMSELWTQIVSAVSKQSAHERT